MYRINYLFCITDSTVLEIFLWYLIQFIVALVYEIVAAGIVERVAEKVFGKKDEETVADKDRFVYLIMRIEIKLYSLNL